MKPRTKREVFKQAVFISPNLDSAQTRVFADAPQYSEVNDASVTAFELTLVANFEERHAGREVKMDNSKKMTVLNNPLIDQSLNEKFSPFYRLKSFLKIYPLPVFSCDQR